MIRLLAALLAPLPAFAAACTQGWERIPTPNASKQGDNVLAAISGRSPTDIWAVGQYAPDTNPNVIQTFAEHFDGTLWTYVATPNDGMQANALTGVAALPDGTAWAVGYGSNPKTFLTRALIEYYNGDSWRIVPTPRLGLASQLLAVSAVSEADIWAVGTYQTTIDSFHALIEHYDGHTWQIVGSPDPGATGNILYAVATFGAADVWAAGQKSGTQDPSHALLLHWNGTVWQPVAAPPDKHAELALYALARPPGGPLAAVGVSESDTAFATPLAETRGDAGWQRASTEADPHGDNHPVGLAFTPDGAGIAVGFINNTKSGNDRTLALIRAPGGSAWSLLPTPNPNPAGNNELAAAAVIGGQLWTVGASDGPNASQTLALRRCN